MRRSSFWLGIPLVIAFTALSPPVHAQKAASVHVIGFDFDDASEDHADSLTVAIRTKLRTTPNWQLVDSNQSLAALLPALKCPPKPDAGCLQRIGDQLKTDRFIWGSVRGAGNHQVAADVHLWARGKPELSTKEVYSDNMKDQNDPALIKVAGRVVEKLTGITGDGTIVVHANVDTGDVFMDGKPVGKLDKGALSFSAGAGMHTIEVRSDGKVAQQQVSAMSGAEAPVTLTFAGAQPQQPQQPDTGPSKPFPIKKVLGWSSVGVGAVMSGIGIFYAVRYFDLRAKNQEEAKDIPAGVNICTSAAYVAQCQTIKDAQQAQTLGWVFGGIGIALVGVGAVILATDRGTPEDKKVTLIPSLGPTGGGIDLVGAF